MKKRPLCMVCLIFILFKSMLLIMTGGQSLIKLPASSIFLEKEYERGVLLQGQVYKKSNTSDVQVLYLKNNSLYSQKGSYLESRMIIYDDTFKNIPIGKTIYVRGTIERFEGARNPGNFDQQLYYARQNIYGYLWSEEIIRVSGKENSGAELLNQLRQSWKQCLLEQLGEENGSVLAAMLLGEKSEMDKDTKELYQKNGISHVLAISGLHISFIGLGIYGLFRRMGASYPIAGILAVSLLTVYVFMIGFSVSVMRAYVMLLFRIGADISGRVYDMLTALMMSAALAIMYQPLYLTDAAFLLSYGAVLGILFVLPAIKSVLPPIPKTLEGCLASMAINICLFPIQLWFYFEFPVYSILFNIILIPLMPWILGLGILGSGLYLVIAPLGGFFLQICGILLSFFRNLGELGLCLPAASAVFGRPNWWEIVIYYLALCAVICFFYQKWKRKKRYFLILGIVLVLIFVKFPDGKLRVTMIDVGQGDGIFIKGPKGGTYLNDGGSSDVEAVGKYRIESFLKSQGVGKLDYVFVTHGDADHYNGIEEMLERQLIGVKIDTLVLPANYELDEKLVQLAETAIAYGSDVVRMTPEYAISEGALQIHCIQPEEGEMKLTGNAGSMVLDVQFRRFDMLLTGDVEAEGETTLIENLTGRTYDVLKVAHHGSKYSSQEAFLKEIKCEIALISAGKNNSYGHPHEETINRLWAYGCRIYETMEYGAIMLETKGEFIDILPSSI